jgi:hypothetical protein
MDKVNEFFSWADEKIGPDKQKHGRMCNETREMIKDCVLNSECFAVGLDLINTRNMEILSTVYRKASINHVKL